MLTENLQWVLFKSEVNFSSRNITPCDTRAVLVEGNEQVI
jgi:hypothetical protein